jgi:glutamine cyclotransferase
MKPGEGPGAYPPGDGAVQKRIIGLAAIAIGFLPIVVGGTGGHGQAGHAAPESIPVYGYELINTFPHDPNAFTQGLVYHDGFLYEGTGLYGGSSLRKVVLESGEVVKRHNLGSAYFGEGVTVYNDTIFQLTWLNHVGFVYVELETFELIDIFSYPNPGWGLTHDDTSLIMSDGTDTLYHLDPVTYEEVGRVHVTADGVPVTQLNELELIRGRIYANILDSDYIAVIEPETGDVVAWLDLTDILPSVGLALVPGPLNGIAFDPDGVRMFVTGKKWPSLFEIYADPLDYPPEIVEAQPPSPVWVETDSVVVFTVSVVDLDPADSLEYTWSINGVIDGSAQDTSYDYTSFVPTIDTLQARVTDGTFSDSTAWFVYVEIAGVEDDPTREGGEVEGIRLAQNRPNPFNPLTTIEFAIPADVGGGHSVCLTVHDTSGRRVKTLIDCDLGPGEYRVLWDGTDGRQERISPGVYFYTLRVGETRLSRRMVLLD